jgi:hypothetical protein
MPAYLLVEHANDSNSKNLRTRVKLLLSRSAEVVASASKRQPTAHKHRRCRVRHPCHYDQALIRGATRRLGALSPRREGHASAVWAY